MRFFHMFHRIMLSSIIMSHSVKRSCEMRDESSAWNELFVHDDIVNFNDSTILIKSTSTVYCRYNRFCVTISFVFSMIS